MSLKTMRYIIFSEDEFDIKNNKYKKNTKYHLRSQDTKCLYVGKYKIVKETLNGTYEIGDRTDEKLKLGGILVKDKKKK
jgi:hypothetical protein